MSTQESSHRSTDHCSRHVWRSSRRKEDSRTDTLVLCIAHIIKPSGVRKFCESCDSCQKRARITCWDRVPITPVPRAEAPFTHWFMDCLGPIFNHKVDYNYCLILVDSATRWPAASLCAVTAESVIHYYNYG